jgi:hypothetical protein
MARSNLIGFMVLLLLAWTACFQHAHAIKPSDNEGVPAVKIDIPPNARAMVQPAESINACRRVLERLGEKGISIWVEDAKSGRIYQSGLQFTKSDLDSLGDSMKAAGKYITLLQPYPAHVFQSVQLKTEQVNAKLKQVLAQRGIDLPGTVDMVVAPTKDVVFIGKKSDFVRMPTLGK